jgi:hypothetical protein
MMHLGSILAQVAPNCSNQQIQLQHTQWVFQTHPGQVSGHSTSRVHYQWLRPKLPPQCYSTKHSRSIRIPIHLSETQVHPSGPTQRLWLEVFALVWNAISIASPAGGGVTHPNTSATFSSVLDFMAYGVLVKGKKEQRT